MIGPRRKKKKKKGGKGAWKENERLCLLSKKNDETANQVGAKGFSRKLCKCNGIIGRNHDKGSDVAVGQVLGIRNLGFDGLSLSMQVVDVGFLLV